MKRIITVIMLLMWFLLSIACDSKEEKGEFREISLNKETFPLSINKEQEKLLDLVGKGLLFAQVQDQEYFYVYSLKNMDSNCEVFQVNDRLEIEGKFVIKSGIGPGEVRNPRIYGSNGKKFIVYDPPAYKYIEFDTSFNLIDEYKVKDLGVFLYSGGCYVPEHQFILDGFTSFKSLYESTVRIYTRKFKENKKIDDVKIFEIPVPGFRKDNQKMVSAKAVHFGFFFDHIYVLDKKNYSLTKMNVEGKVVKQVNIKFESKTFPEKLREKWVEEFYGKNKVNEFDYPETLWPACWLLRIGDGIAVGRCLGYSHEVNGPIEADYFDSALNFLGKISIPYFQNWNDPSAGQQILYARLMYRNGKLYIIGERDNGYMISKWNVKVEKI